MAQLFTPPFQQTLDANADAVSGARLLFYISGTTTPAAVYADAALTTPLPSPVIADAAGRFVPIYLDAKTAYRVVVADAAGAPIRDVDPLGDTTIADLADGEGLAIVGFRQAGAGAVDRKALDKARERLTVTHFPGVLSTEAAIQTGINALADRGGGTLHFPAGTYTVNPSTLVTDYSASNDPAYGPLYRCFEMGSGVAFTGKNATIRLAGGVSSVASPKNVCLFHSSASLSDVSFDGIVFDLNGQNNPVGSAGRAHHAAIMFTGLIGKCDRMRVENCSFLNTAGSGVIVAGFKMPPTGLGKDWWITRCYFAKNGLSSYDHSSIYG